MDWTNRSIRTPRTWATLVAKGWGRSSRKPGWRDIGPKGSIVEIGVRSPVRWRWSNGPSHCNVQKFSVGPVAGSCCFVGYLWAVRRGNDGGRHSEPRCCPSFHNGPRPYLRMSVHSVWMVMATTRPLRGKQNKHPMCASAVYRQSRMPTAGAKTFCRPCVRVRPIPAHE